MDFKLIKESTTLLSNFFSQISYEQSNFISTDFKNIYGIKSYQVAQQQKQYKQIETTLMRVDQC